MLDLSQYNLKTQQQQNFNVDFIINYFVHNTAARILPCEVDMHAACKT